jgi:hypothetical protein
MAAAPPWRQVLGPSGELYLVGLACGSDHLAARVTDLRGWWEGWLEASAIDEQRELCCVSSATAKVVAKVARGFAGDWAEGDYTLRVTPSAGAHQPVQLKWQVGYLSLVLDCEPVADPAARLRDELTLPLLRSVQLLESMVPPGTASTWLAHPVDPRSLPLPDFRSPIVCRLLAPAPASACPALRDASGEGGPGDAAAPGRGASGIGEGETAAAAGPAPILGADAAAAAARPPHAAPVSGEDARMRKQRLKRERAAAEAAARGV